MYLFCMSYALDFLNYLLNIYVTINSIGTLSRENTLGPKYYYH